MTVHAPLKLTFYDPETVEPVAEFSCNFITVRLLKLAIRLAKSPVNINKDTLEGLVVDVFENKFTLDELRRGTDENDRMQVLQDIMSRAGSFMPEKPDGEVVESQEDDEDDNWLEDLEITLVKSFGWNLYEIDHMDIESLFPFVNRYAGTAGKEPAKKLAYIDQVSWI